MVSGVKCSKYKTYAVKGKIRNRCESELCESLRTVNFLTRSILKLKKKKKKLILSTQKLKQKFCQFAGLEHSEVCQHNAMKDRHQQ